VPSKKKNKKKKKKKKKKKRKKHSVSLSGLFVRGSRVPYSHWIVIV
jgi:hypothetical protein